MFMRLTYTCMLCIEKGLPLAILGVTSIRSAFSCVGCIRLLFTSLSVGYVTFCKFLVYDGHVLACHFVWYYRTFCIRCFHGMVCKLQSLGKCHVCYVVLWPSACLHAVVELFLFHNWLPQVRWPLLCMKNFLFVSCACAYVCVATCACRVHTHVCVSECGVARRGGLVCIRVLLQSHGYIQYIARVVIMFTFGVGVGRERKKSWNYPYKNRSVSGSEKPLLVLPRRKSKKLKLAHCPPKCELNWST